MKAKWPVILLLILICIPILSPTCSGKVLNPVKNVITYYDVFEGENENWKAKFVLNESHVFITSGNKTSYYGKEKQHLSITYNGNLSELSTPKQINLSYRVYTPHSRGTLEIGRATDFDKKEYTLKHSNIYYMEDSTEVQSPVSTQTILWVKNKWTNPMAQKLRSGNFPDYPDRVPSGWRYLSYYRWIGLSRYPHIIYKPPGHCLVVWHTVDFYPPYKTVYTHHEGMGGTEVDQNKNVTVTVELDGLVETLELKSTL